MTTRAGGYGITAADLRRRGAASVAASSILALAALALGCRGLTVEVYNRKAMVAPVPSFRSAGPPSWEDRVLLADPPPPDEPKTPSAFRPQDVPEKWQHNLNLAPHMKPIPLGPLAPRNARRKGGRKRR